MSFFDDLFSGLPVVGDVFKSRQARKNRNATRSRLGRNRAAFRADYLEPLFAQARMFALQGQEAQQAGFDRARTAIGQMGNASRQRILDSQAGAAGNIQQSLASRGLYNTTIFDAANMGLFAQTQRAFSELDQQLIGLQADLEQRAGAADAAAFANFQNLTLQELDAQGQVENDILNSISGVDPVSPGFDFAELAALIGGGMGGGGLSGVLGALGGSS